MCYIQRTVAEECGHPLEDDVDQCPKARAEGVAQCIEDEDNQFDDHFVPGVCPLCDEKAIDAAVQEDGPRIAIATDNEDVDEEDDGYGEGFRPPEHDGYGDEGGYPAQSTAEYGDYDAEAEADSQYPPSVNQDLQGHPADAGAEDEEQLRQIMELSLQEAQREEEARQVAAANASAEEEAEIQRLLQQSAQEFEAQVDQVGAQAAEDEAELQRLLQLSAQEFEAQAEQMSNDDAQLQAILEASRHEFEQKAQAQESEEAMMARVMQESAAEFEEAQKNPPVDEEAELERIKQESMKEYENKLLQPNEEEEGLQRILELSMNDYNHRLHGDDTFTPADPYGGGPNAYEDLDPNGKGKGRRDDYSQGGPPGTNAKVDDLHTRLDFLRLANEDGGQPGPSAISRKPGEQSEESRVLGEIRARQQAAYDASLAADKEKARRRTEGLDE